MMGNPNDHIHSLGYLALGSRLKRISDALYAACAEFYKANGVEFEPSNFPLLTLIEQQKVVSLSDAATALGITQAAISQKATQMQKAGLIKLTQSTLDKRSKSMSLTTKGQVLIGQLQPLWYAIRQTQHDIGSELLHPLLPLLDAFETAISGVNLLHQMATHLRDYYAERIVITQYNKTLSPHFKRLNELWLNEYFSIEPHDKKVLGDPQRYILDRGGRIYFALLDAQVVGTCALYPEESDDKTGASYEFTKMAMDPNLRGKGIGRRMLAHVIEEACGDGIERLYLLTSSKLNPACHLYRTMGFTDVPLTAQDAAKYNRADVKMELWLNQTNRSAA